MDNTLPPFQSFAGQFIIAAQNETGQFFDKSVILITRHSQNEGAEGYIINQPMTLAPSEIFKKRNIAHLGTNFHLMRGGPVDMDHGAVLHSDEYHALDTKPLLNHLALTETQQILDDIADRIGPEHFLVLVGKAAWVPSQLEEEIMGNMWIPAPFSFNVLFNTPDNKKWQEALATLKIDANLLTNQAGKA